MATYYVSTEGSNTAPYDTWAKAATSLATAVTAASTAFDTILIASNETHTVTSATNYSCISGLKVISANKSTSAQEAGAIISYTPSATSELRISVSAATNTSAYFYGITFQFGVSGYTHTLRIAAFCDTCVFSRLYTATLNFDGRLIQNNCTFVNAAGVTSTITTSNSGGVIEYRNCIFFTSGGLPSAPMSSHAIAALIGCDLSAFTNPFPSLSAGAIYTLINCKLHSSISYSSQTFSPSVRAEYFACSAGDTVLSYVLAAQEGTVSNNTGVYLTSGGTTLKEQDNSDTNISTMLVSQARAHRAMPLYSPYYNFYISSTGSKTVSIKIAHTLAAVLTNVDAFIEVEYYGNSSDPQATLAMSRPVLSGTISPDILVAPSDLTDTTEAWTGITSEITHTLSVTFTANQIGWARARVCLAKPSTTIYVNPAVAVS